MMKYSHATLRILILFQHHLNGHLWFFFQQQDRGRRYEVDVKTREEITSLIAHHVTAVNYIYRNTKFDGRNEHRNIRFEVSLPIHPYTYTHTHTHIEWESGGITSTGGQTMIMRQGLHKDSIPLLLLAKGPPMMWILKPSLCRARITARCIIYNNYLNRNNKKQLNGIWVTTSNVWLIEIGISNKNSGS